jgi:Electron transfer DM13
MKSSQMGQSKRKIIAIAAIVVAIGLWAAFRPERLFVNATVNESFPAAQASTQARVLATGNFHTGAHDTSGTATVNQLGDGTRVLRLTNFKTSNGPDVHVYLVAANDVTDNATVTSAGFVDLGSLKGNIGDQNYAIPASVDLSEYRAATIWCKRFSVNFGTAPLAAGGMQASTAEQVELAAGSFHTNAHETDGMASIHQLADGTRVLRLTNFKTSNGPDVHVYLVAANDVNDNATVTSAGFIDLGSLKGNIGDQNYGVPANVDLAKYRAATIWCKRFSVNFGTAPLNPKS